MTTLQDVARHAGVSIATVSKALSNTPYVAEKTREKVLHAVHELGYTPNLAARALSRGKTNIIGVVFPYVYDPIFSDPLTMQIIEGIEQECRERGYHLLLSSPYLSLQGTSESYQRLIKSGYMDGMIAIDNVPVASVTTPALQSNIPTVTIGYHKAMHSVRSDDGSGGEQLLKHLLSHGHRNIGIISVPQDTNFALNARLEGIRDAAKQYQIDFASFYLAFGDYSTASGSKAAAQLISDHTDLTAILCLNDRMAIGALQYLQSIDCDVPGHVSVVGYDNIGASEMTVPALTTVTQQAMEQGRQAARMLLTALQGEMPSPVVLPTQLIVRGSSGAARQ